MGAESRRNVGEAVAVPGPGRRIDDLDRALVDALMADGRMSLTDLAAKVDVTLANLSILKTGKAKAIRFSTLNKLCRVLECQPGELLSYEPSDDDVLEEAADQAAE